MNDVWRAYGKWWAFDKAKKKSVVRVLRLVNQVRVRAVGEERYIKKKLKNFKKPLTSKEINGRMDKSSGKTIWQAKLNKSEKNDLNQSIFLLINNFEFKSQG